MMKGIFIPLNVPSSKNSKKWTGKFLISSDATQSYIKNTTLFYRQMSVLFVRECIERKLERPYKVGFHFVRKSRHKSDWINLCQIVQDLMVKHQWIDDDNMDEMIPFPLEKNGKYYTYDKTNPGVYIELL